ncbi:MAG: exodeoxyribonuclease VII small subunit [Candidatus Dormibacteria bacterium]
MEREPEALKAPATGAEALDYEAALGELDAVLGRLEDGKAPLEEAMELYERGVALVRRCSGLLDGAEKRVMELSLGPEGDPVERPFDSAVDLDPAGGRGA